MRNTLIQWAKHSWNPAIGCRKVSAGCKFCYAERIIEGKSGEVFTNVRRTSADNWREPYRIHQKLTGSEPLSERLVFTCSMSDLFIEEIDNYRADIWRIIRETPNLIYQILTKRPERIQYHLPRDWGNGYQNVWLGVSVENGAMFDRRVPVLAEIPVGIRFISFEPLIDRINITDARHTMLATGIHWAIIGGESGNETGKYGYRLCHLDWMRHLVENMPDSTAIFVKQLGTHIAKAMRLLDLHGGNIEQFPDDLQIRNYPPCATMIPKPEQLSLFAS